MMLLSFSSDAESVSGSKGMWSEILRSSSEITFLKRASRVESLCAVLIESITSLLIDCTVAAMQQFPCVSFILDVQIKPDADSLIAHCGVPLLKLSCARYSYPFAVAQMSSLMVTREASYTPKLRIRQLPPPRTYSLISSGLYSCSRSL